MLAVKDFKKGQKAYIVTDDYGTRENSKRTIASTP